MTQSQTLQQLFQKAPHDKNKLITLLKIGRHKGFGNFVNRKQIWPYLLGLNSQKIKQTPVFQWKGGMDRTSNDFDQLLKDAQRSLSSMKTFEDITKFHLKKKQEAVLSVLDTFFAKNNDLRYLQGFHDVASIFLILFGNSTGYYLIEKAGRTYFYDFLCFQFGQVGRAVSRIVYDMVTQIDPQFKKIFQSFQMTQFLIFLIPWILTWFAHNFSSVKTICRIWDYLLCTGPYGIFYMASAIILMTKNELLNNCSQLDDPNIQTFYQQLAKKQAINIQKAISLAIQIQMQVNVQNTVGFMMLHQKSMLKYQNFKKQNSVHVQFYIERRKMQQRKKNLYKFMKIGATVLAVTAVALVIKNGDKLKSLAGEL